MSFNVCMERETHLLRTTLVYVSFCLLICGASHAQTAATTPSGVEPQRVSLYDGIVSFVPPEGFTPPSDEVIRKKFPNATSPATVYANARTTTSIAISYHPSQALKPEQLPEFKAAMRSFMEKQQVGSEWLKDELVEINGRRWVHFELVTVAVDARIHNHMLFTSVDRRMLLFNFNSTLNEYATYEDALARSIASIRVTRK